MATFRMEKALETIHSGSPVEIAVKLALVGSLSYHFLFQFPRQAEVMKCLLAVGLWNVLFLLLAMFAGPFRNFLSWCAGIFVFNITFVAASALLKVFANVCLRHRGIPTELSLSASDWGLWRSSFKDGDTHLRIAELHKHHGSVVRIQPNHLSFNSVKAMEDIHSIKAKSSKGALYSQVMKPPYLPGNIFSTTDKARHALLRRTIGPSLSGSSINQFEPTLKKYNRDFMRTLTQAAEANDGIVDMTDWFNRFSFDIAGALTFGQDFEALNGGDIHPAVLAFHKHAYLIGLFMFIPWLAQFLQLFPPPKAVLESRGEFHKFSFQAIEKKRNEEEKEGDRTIIGNILRAVDPQTGAKFSLQDVHANSNIFIIASSDTTATALTFTTYYLLSKRQYWDRLCDEIRSKFNSADEITHAAVVHLPFLDAVIHEGLRLRPPVIGSLQRETPPEGAIIDGQFVPGRTTVSSATWAIMRDDKNFSNPDSFIPTRWIGSEREQETCNKAAWIPFSYGPRNCIGKALALMELRVVLATFALTFDVEFIEDGQPAPYFKDAFVALRGPLPLRLSPRFKNQ